MSSTKENIVFSGILILLILAGFWSGMLYHSQVIDHKVKSRDTIVFKSHNQDSMKLHVVLQDGKLQSFWYSKRHVK